MNTFKIVKMLPDIKTEPVDIDETGGSCQGCNKYFISKKALDNHMRMEHCDILYQQGNETWMRNRIVPKTEVVEFDEDTVGCRGCEKTFVTEKALENHVRMEHFELYPKGRGAWMTRLNTSADAMDPSKFIKMKTKEMLSSMVPTSLTTLASEDVSYIIIKADPDELSSPKRKKKTEKEKDKEKIAVRKPKEVQPITGPFECLQPSNLVPQKTCHQIFFSCCEYSVHFRDEHTKRRKGLRCQVCEKPLANPANEEGLPYTCDLCGVGHLSSEALEEHIAASHVKQRPYECSICHKRFTQKGGVQQHMRMHTGDKPYTCSFCPKAFTQKSGLGQHLRIHTRVKPYRCVICSKAFCQSIHLKQHMRTHTNVSPFQCGICQKRFKQSSHLNYHLKYHNLANLTEEQKRKYTELIGMMATESAENGEIDENQVAVENLEESVTFEVQSEEAEHSINEGDVVVEVFEDDDTSGYILQTDFMPMS